MTNHIAITNPFILLYFFFSIFTDLESSVNSFYRPHKMALWNHLVPDLVELSVQEREVDKLPHSKYPIEENTENEAKNGGHHRGGGGDYRRPHDKSKTTNSAGGGSEDDGSPAKNPTLNRERISEVSNG